MPQKKNEEKKAPVVDPKRVVEVIEVDYLEDVIGGLGGNNGPNRRMAADA